MDHLSIVSCQWIICQWSMDHLSIVNWFRISWLPNLIHWFPVSSHQSPAISFQSSATSLQPPAQPGIGGWLGLAWGWQAGVGLPAVSGRLGPSLAVSSLKDASGFPLKIVNGSFVNCQLDSNQSASKSNPLVSTLQPPVSSHQPPDLEAN